MDKSDQFTQIVEDYIDEHERLAENDAFQSADETIGYLLSEVWRIVQSRPVTESDEAVADIRSLIWRHIRDRAESLADKVIENLEMHGDGRVM